MEELTLTKIVERNAKQNEDCDAAWYAQALETAICSLSKSPAATDILLEHLGEAYAECNLKTSCADALIEVPELAETIAAVAPIVFDELRAKAPELEAKDFAAAITKGFNAVGLKSDCRNTDDNLDDRADSQEAL